MSTIQSWVQEVRSEYIGKNVNGKSNLGLVCLLCLSAAILSISFASLLCFVNREALSSSLDIAAADSVQSAALFSFHSSPPSLPSLPLSFHAFHRISMRRRSSMPPTSQSDEHHAPSSAPHRRSSFSSLLPWHHSDSSPPSPASSFSSTASAIDDPPIRNRPWHIHDRSHPKFLTGPLHDLELNLIKTRKAMEESKAEEIHSFPDASETLRTRPLLQNSRRKVNFGW